MVQRAQVIISPGKVDPKNDLSFARSLGKQDRASSISIERNFKTYLTRIIVRNDFRIVQQKHTFAIERESVRLMFRAKPLMMSVVGQLLVDWSRKRCGRKRDELKREAKRLLA